MNKKINTLIPDIRFPEFQKDGNWQLTNIGEIGKFYYGKSAPKWSLSNDAPTLCVRYGELYTKFDTIISEIISRTNIDPSNLKFSKGGEILVPRVGEVPQDFAKNCCYLPFPNIAIGEMISVYETKEYPIFYAYYFRTLIKQFAEVVEGQNVKNLYYVNLEPIAVGKPSYLEQQKIAACLSSIDDVIKANSQKLDILKDHKKGLLQNLFPQKGESVPKYRFPEFVNDGLWVEKTLDEICDVNPSSNELPNEFVYIDLESVENGILTQKKNITLDVAPSRAQRLLKKNDVIYQMVRPYQMNNFFFQIEGEIEYVASTGYAQLRAFESSEFLFQLIHTQNFVDIVLIKCTGSNYPAINSSDLKSIKIKIPKPKEQQKIADCLSSLDALIIGQTLKIEQLKLHKKGLMQRLFPKLEE